MVREKIANKLRITCNDVDLTALTNIEFYVKQPHFFKSYTPAVISPTEMVVIIPFSDAKALTVGIVELQFAFTNREGNPDASDIVKMRVSDLLNEAGYDPV